MPLFPLILPAASFPPLRGFEFVPTISLELELQCRLWIGRCDFMHRDRRHTAQETVSIYELCWRFVRQRHKMAPLSLRLLWSAMSLVLCLSHLAANMAPSARLWSRLHVDATNAISSILMRWPGSKLFCPHGPWRGVHRSVAYLSVHDLFNGASCISDYLASSKKVNNNKYGEDVVGSGRGIMWGSGIWLENLKKLRKTLG